MNESPVYREKENKAWIGVDIGGTKTAVVISSCPPVMLARIEFPTLPDEGPERAIELIKRSIHQLIDTLGIEKSRLMSIGVSLRRPIGSSRGNHSGAPEPIDMGRCSHHLNTSTRIRDRMPHGK